MNNIEDNIKVIIEDFNIVANLLDDVDISALPIELQIEYLQINSEMLLHMKEFVDDIKKLVVKASILGCVKEKKND